MSLPLRKQSALRDKSPPGLGSPGGQAGGQRAPTWDRTFSWLSASLCRVSASVGGTVGAVGGSLVPARVTPTTLGATPRASQRASSRGWAMRARPEGLGLDLVGMGSGSDWARGSGWSLRRCSQRLPPPGAAECAWPRRPRDPGHLRPDGCEQLWAQGMGRRPGVLRREGGVRQQRVVHRAATGSPRSPSEGCREPGSQGPADCGERAEGGRSLYCAGRGGAASDSGGGGGKGGRAEGGPKARRPTRPGGSGLSPRGGWSGVARGPLSFL